MIIIDEKVINVLTYASSEKFFICKCNPTAMNDLDDKICDFDVHLENLKYGVFLFHA